MEPREPPQHGVSRCLESRRRPSANVIADGGDFMTWRLAQDPRRHDEKRPADIRSGSPAYDPVRFG